MPHYYPPPSSDDLTDDPNPVVRKVKLQLLILTAMLVVMWGVECLDTFVADNTLYQYGIRPRTLLGLRGIFFMPFLHGSWNHLAANSFPLFTLGWLVMLRRIADFFIVSTIVIVLGGLGVWLLGRSGAGYHIGASGLLFGYFGYLLMRGYFERSSTAIAVAVLVMVLYGSMFFGIFPQGRGISWEAHLFGFVAGGIAAWWLTQRRRS